MKRPALWCALLVFLHAAMWAVVTPAFHVPDEPQHMAYAQYVAETGELTTHIEGAVFSDEEAYASDGVRFNDVVGNPSGRPPWSADEDTALERLLNSGLSRDSEGAGTSTTNNPPLYYLVEAVPYHVAGDGDFFDRLLAMRLTSALMAGLTALFVFGFVRELLPGAPLAWTVGALAAGLTPLVGFMGGGVNNDVGLMLAAAATLWALARAFRRGLDLRSGLLVGACFGLALITKVNIAGFAPGLLIAGGVLLARQWRDGRREALQGIAAAAGAIALPVLLYVVAINTVWDRPLWSGGIAFSTAGGVEAATARTPELAELASYLWQFYLPPLPGMIYDPPVDYGLWDIWFTGWIGRLGWLDYDFPEWAFTVAGIVWAGLLALAARGLWVKRAALRRRRGELAAYAAVVVGLLLVSNIQGYRYTVDSGFAFEQARYLLPLLALYAGVVGVAVIGAGRRAPVAATAIVALTLVHGLGALVITLGRYYV